MVWLRLTPVIYPSQGVPALSLIKVTLVVVVPLKGALLPLLTVEAFAVQALLQPFVIVPTDGLTVMSPEVQPAGEPATLLYA